MDVGHVGDGTCVIDTSHAKLDFSMTGSDAMTVHTNSIKLQETNLVAQAVQSISSLVTLTPDSALSNSGLPFGTILSMTSPTMNGVHDQVLMTLQPMNNALVDLDDNEKAEIAESDPMVGVDANMNGSAQIVINGNVQTVVNLPALQGYPQMTMMSYPTMTGMSGSAMSPSGSTLAQATNTATGQSSPISIQRVIPQPMGMPQMVFTGGQLVHGINGTQYLIPSSQSAPPQQQIITIPVNQLNTGQQLVQLLMPNGQIVTASLGNQPPANGNTMQQHSVVASSAQALGIPQIVTNSSGQILAVSPQLMNQPTGLVQMYCPTGQLQSEKQQIIQINGHATLAKTSISTSASTLLSPQAHIQVATVGDTSQIQNQVIQSTSPPQIIQVAQTSSPSITSTESITPICQTSANTVDGIDLEEIKEFAKMFKMRRLTLGLTQTQVGQALNVAEGPAYSQSAICRFEKLDITPKSAQKIKPVLERWMKEAEERYRNGSQTIMDVIGDDANRRRKRRTSFTPQALQMLSTYFEKNPRPSGSEMTSLARKLQYDREVVRVWFCNKRQTLKGTGKKPRPIEEFN